MTWLDVLVGLPHDVSPLAELFTISCLRASSHVGSCQSLPCVESISPNRPPIGNHQPGLYNAWPWPWCRRVPAHLPLPASACIGGWMSTSRGKRKGPVLPLHEEAAAPLRR